MSATGIQAGERVLEEALVFGEPGVSERVNAAIHKCKSQIVFSQLVDDEEEDVIIKLHEACGGGHCERV